MFGLPALSTLSSAALIKILAVVIIVFLSLLGGAGAYIWWIDKQRVSAEATLAAQSIQLTQAAYKVSRLETQQVAMQIFSDSVNEALSAYRNQRETTNQKLESHKDEGANKALRKKPATVERLINGATDRVFDELECATGACGSKGVAPAAP